MRSLQFVIALSLLGASSAHADLRATLKARCHAALVWVGAVTKPSPEFFLTDADRRAIEDITREVNLSDDERFEALREIWLEARLAHMSEIDRQIVTNASPHMSDQAYLGVRADGLLEETVKLPGMETSIVKLVDYVHDVESDIMNLETAGRITDRPQIDRADMNQHYRNFALRGEWEILNALPRPYVRAEMARVKALKLPAANQSFALGLLEDGKWPYASFLKMQNRKFLGHGRILDWRTTNNPHWDGSPD